MPQRGCISGESLEEKTEGAGRTPGKRRTRKEETNYIRPLWGWFVSFGSVVLNLLNVLTGACHL